jgi:hypothetical protein
LCCLLNGDSASFERTAQNLLKTTGVRIGAELLRQTVEGEGRHVIDCLAQGRLQPTWNASDCHVDDGSGHGDGDGVTRQYLGCDGFITRLITDAEKRRRRRTVCDKRRRRRRCRQRGNSSTVKPLPRMRRGADQPFKEFKLVTFYDQDAQHRLVSVTRHDHHAAGRLMRRDGGRCGFDQASQRLAVIDGGPWIINQIHRQSMPVTAEGKASAAVCLDFFHLAENVHRARRVCFGEDDPVGCRWASDLLHLAKHEGYEPLLEQLLCWRGTLRAAGKRHAAQLLINYITDRREMICYPQFIKSGWQIGSGPTESQCKQVPRRIKARGKRWDADHAQALMTLEAMRQSGLDDAYWKTCARHLN